MSLFPGLPALPNSAASAFSAVVLLIEDLIGGFGSIPRWGIFTTTGDQVVDADSVVSVDFRQDFRITDAALEAGSFSSYNKVQIPFDIKLRFATGGSSARRRAFLDSIAEVIGDTELYDVVTPEAIYSNLNLVHQDYVRSATRGQGMVSVDVWAREVRPASLSTSGSTTTSAQNGNSTTTSPVGGRNVTGVISFRNTQSPAAQTQINGGNVQPQSPSAAQTSKFDDAFSSFG
jgi:hypothetical protein